MAARAAPGSAFLAQRRLAFALCASAAGHLGLLTGLPEGRRAHLHPAIAIEARIAAREMGPEPASGVSAERVEPYALSLRRPTPDPEVAAPFPEAAPAARERRQWAPVVVPNPPEK